MRVSSLSRAVNAALLLITIRSGADWTSAAVSALI